MSIDTLIQEGLAILKRNMETYPSFDPNKPYEEKNSYFNEVAQLSADLFRYDELVVPAEKYYRTMLDAILTYEQQNTKRFNKGIVYANLGIVQIASGNLDEGICHLLMADREDAVFSVNPHGLLEEVLWKQFEQPHVIATLIQLNNNVNANLNFVVTEDFVYNFFRGMDLQDRLFLEGSIWSIKNNLDYNCRHSNDYTRGRLFSGLKDLYLLTESLLRKKQINQELIRANSQIMLSNLLTNAVGSLGIGYPQPDLPVGANSLQDFLNNLETIIQSAQNPEVRRIYCLHLVRNFTGHHFDLSSQVRSAQGNEFFDLYEIALTNVLSAILYFAHETLI